MGTSLCDSTVLQKSQAVRSTQNNSHCFLATSPKSDRLICAVGIKKDIKKETENSDHSHALVWLLCTVGVCTLFQFCRTFCKKRAVDGTVSDFMTAYTEDHRETLAKVAGVGDGSKDGLGSPLLAAPKGREIAASHFQAT